MKSYWDIRYTGSHTNIFIKKFERAFSVKALEIEQERFAVDAKKYERATFLIQHRSVDWQSLVVEVLELANKCAWHWNVVMGLTGKEKSLYGELREERDDAPVFARNLPAGFYSLHWEVRNDQVYDRKRLSSAPDAW